MIFIFPSIFLMNVSLLLKISIPNRQSILMKIPVVLLTSL